MANREYGISLPPVKRASGFPGQRLVVVHPPQMARFSRLALLKSFFPTDIGSFRTATGHERRRLSGSLQTIFIYCTEGNGWCEIEGVRHVIRAENLLVIPSRCPHSYGASEQNSWSIEWFHAAGIGVDEIVCRLEIGRSAPLWPWNREHGIRVSSMRFFQVSKPVSVMLISYTLHSLWLIYWEESSFDREAVSWIVPPSPRDWKKSLSIFERTALVLSMFPRWPPWRTFRPPIFPDFFSNIPDIRRWTF